jgi:hypothetical protein
VSIPLESAAHATPEWLTQTLHEAGVLKAGKVVHIERTANTAYHAQTTRLRVTYAGTEPGQPATQLFLKLLSEHRGKREIEVYRQLMSTPHYPAMTVPCYSAIYDSVSGGSSLLLADLSDTHREVCSRDAVRAFTASPPLEQVEGVVETLARWHALGWAFGGSEHLPASRFDIFTDETHYQGYAAHCRKAWFQFAEAEPALAAEVEGLYLPLVEKMPHLWSRYLARRFEDRTNLTLIHGDCYFSQFLCPAEQANQMFIIDFDSVRLDIPTDDLVFLTTFWQREARRDHEPTLLKRYHEALQSAGIGTYPWETFLEDYRFSTLQHAMYPILGATGHAATEHDTKHDEVRFWQARLSAITAAYETWDCAGFLEQV